MVQARAELEAVAKASGAKAFGVADLDMLRQKVPDLLTIVGEGYCRAVVAGMRLQDAVIEGIQNQPTPIYFHNYRQLNYQLDRLAWELADLLQDRGYKAYAVPASQIIKSDPMSGHISHKLLGWAAGLGFIGRQSLLVHPEFGARMRYVSVLTDAPLIADVPYQGDGCGACRACISVCPAGAIKQERGDFDLAACYSKLTEFTRLSFIGQHVCGVCVKACSAANRRASQENC